MVSEHKKNVKAVDLSPTRTLYASEAPSYGMVNI
jgi:hypothetical protein